MSSENQVSVNNLKFLLCFISLFCVRISVASEQPGSCRHSLLKTYKAQSQSSSLSGVFFFPACSIKVISLSVRYLYFSTAPHPGVSFELQLSLCCLVCCILFFLLLRPVNIPSCGTARRGLRLRASAVTSKSRAPLQGCFALTGRQVTVGPGRLADSSLKAVPLRGEAGSRLGHSVTLQSLWLQRSGVAPAPNQRM